MVATARGLAAAVCALWAWVAVGCTTAGGASHAPGADTSEAGGDTTEPAVVPTGWSTLVEADWRLDPWTEAYVCALETVEEDVLIRGFEAVAPPGTHHGVVTVTEPHGADGVFDCGPGTLSDAMIFSSGLGTDGVELPDGVAMRVPAGKQVLLNLHLFNASDVPLEGTSGVRVETVAEGEVVEEAEMLFAGTIDISLPPGDDGSATGSCVFEEDATLLGLWPHMHQHGRRMVVEHHGADGVNTLHDAGFDFFHQLQRSLDPLLVRAGDRLDVTCYWTNTSDEHVGFGDSSMDEMCFVGLYRYPATSHSLYCDLPF